MKIAIVGSRAFKDYELLKKTILEHKGVGELIEKKLVTVVSGGAIGADQLGEKLAKEFSLQTVIHLPDWNKHGRSAGFIRNKLIIDDADIVFAFWDGKSPGTKSSIDLAKKADKELIVSLY